MSDAPLLHTGVRAVQSVNLLLAFLHETWRLGGDAEQCERHATTRRVRSNTTCAGDEEDASQHQLQPPCSRVCVWCGGGGNRTN